METCKPYWSITVSFNGDEAFTIEPEMLAGRELTDVEEEAAECAARRVLGFLGKPCFCGEHTPKEVA